MEALEDRRLMTVNYDPMTSVLQLQGDNLNNHFEVSYLPGTAGHVRVWEDGVVRLFNPSVTPIVQITADLMDGNDMLSVDPSLMIPIFAEGGMGSDTLEGGALSDTLLGDEQNDFILGNGGDDLLNGNDDHDTIWGGDGVDRIWGELGNDFLYGEEQGDFIWGGDDSDDYIEGGDGDDELYGGSGNDTIWGEDGVDKLLGEGGEDWLDGGLLGDTLIGGDNADELFGQEGDDDLQGGPGADNLDGGEGTDKLHAGIGDDTLYGGDGNDFLDGGEGDDTLDGGEGDDVLHGGNDDDTLHDTGLETEGESTDATEENEDESTDEPAPGNHDRLEGGEGDDTLIGGVGNDVLLGGEGVDVLEGESGDDELDGGENGDILQGGPGNDRLQGGAGDDRLYGGPDNDLLFTGSGSDTAEGGEGDDTFVSIDNDATDRLVGENGFDSFWIDRMGGALGTSDNIVDANDNEEETNVHRVDSFVNGADKTLDGDAIPDPPERPEDDVEWSNYAKKALFSPAGPEVTDVDQGNVGTCWLLSSIAAAVHASPNVIYQTIADLGDGTYVVELNDKHYRIDADLPHKVGKRAFLRYAKFGAEKSIWVALIEKGWAESRGGYEKISGGIPYFSLGKLGGEDRQLHVTDTLEGTLTEIAESGRSAVACTKMGDGNTTYLVDSHCYAIVDVVLDAFNNPIEVTLYNPHGDDNGTDAYGDDGDANDGFVTLTVDQLAGDLQTWGGIISADFSHFD